MPGPGAMVPGVSASARFVSARAAARPAVAAPWRRRDEIKVPKVPECQECPGAKGGLTVNSARMTCPAFFGPAEA